MWKDNLPVRCLRNEGAPLELPLHEHNCNLADTTETQWEEHNCKSDVKISLQRGLWDNKEA